LCKLVAVVLFRACGRRGHGFGHGMDSLSCEPVDFATIAAALPLLIGLGGLLLRLTGQDAPAGPDNAKWICSVFQPGVPRVWRLREVISAVGMWGKHLGGYLSHRRMLMSTGAPSTCYGSPQGYGLVSRIMHWSMAALFAWQFVSS